MATHPVKIMIKKVKTDPRYYPRFQVDQGRVIEFVEAMECGEYFPSIKVVKDKKTGMYILLDGKHRLEARMLRGEVEILADVFFIPEEHWLMAAARFNGKSSKPLHADEIKQIIAASWRAGIKNTEEIAREMGRTVRYIEMVLKPVRDEERNKRKEKILDLHQQGMSQRKIASEIGLSFCCINSTIKSIEGGNDGVFKNQNESVSGVPDELPEIDQVIYKRSDFVFRSPDENNDIKDLNSSPEKSGLDFETASPINSTELEPDEGCNDESILNPTDDISGTPDELSEVDQVFAKRTKFVLRTPCENNHINMLDTFPRKLDPSCETATPKNSIQIAPLPTDNKLHNDSGPTQKTTRYPSYLDQIDFYRELPVQSQNAIRAMELAKKYKMDIIDMVKEIDEPVIWIKKVLVAAMALSLMRGNKLDDASNVETLLGISFDTARCIQSALPFQTMLCPISPDMEQWAKDNLSPKDLDLILSLVEVNKNDLHHLLKGETPPKKTNCFKALPDCYKDQLQTSIAVLRELRDHARNKRFNGDSAKQLLVHLNKNVTVVNEIFDGLREK